MRSVLHSLVVLGVAFALISAGGCSRDERPPAKVAEKKHPASLSVQDTQSKGTPSGEDAVKVPRITSVKLFPQNYMAGVDIRAEAHCSEETSQVKFVYTWYINDKLYPFADYDVLPASAFQRGDMVRLEVTPRLGLDAGETFSLKPVQIPNGIPQITSTPSDASMVGMVYTYNVTATDADGDPLTYFLRDAPGGMAIDSSRGVVTWDMAQASEGAAEGEVTFKVGVRDDHEGVQVQAVRLKLGRVNQGGEQ